MPVSRQLFRRSLAETLAELLGQHFPTAKALHRGIKIDISTAENLRKGHLSVPTLEKALDYGGRELWEKLGDELFGETFYQFEERRINAAIREAEGVRSNLVRLRSESEKLLERPAFMDPARLGTAADAVGRAEGGTGSGAHQEGHRGFEGQRVEPLRPVDLRSPPGFRGRK